MSPSDHHSGFNPDDPGDTSGGLFGLPFRPDQADIIVVPVPWEVTVSYRAGTARGPAAILNASPQLDLFDEEYGNVWEAGISMLDIPADVLAENDRMRPIAQLVIEFQEAGGSGLEEPFLEAQLGLLNESCEKMVRYVRETTGQWLEAGKKVVLLGGDHSTPLGYLQALAERHDDFGILQIDAHMDLRESYEGFQYSHASIMHNALELPQVSKLFQVGLRDFSESEFNRAGQDPRIAQFTGRELHKNRFAGISWHEQCLRIVADLPAKVYISFDIDGLDPSLCPHTGTPVPGGLGFEETLYLLDQVVQSGREIIGADLVEVAPGEDEWDGNVGARILYRLCALLAAT